MDYKPKRMASAKGIKRVAAAAASAMLIGTSVPATVVAALAPQVALAYGEGDILGYMIGGIGVVRCASETKLMTYTFGSGDDAVVVNVDFTNNPNGTQAYTYKGQSYDSDNNLFELMGTEDFTRAELYTKQRAYKPVKVIIVSGDDRDKQRLETAVISDDGKVTFTPIKDFEGWNYCNYEVVWGVDESYPADFKATHGTVKFLTEDSPKAPVAETHDTLSGFTAAVPIADEGYHFVGWTKAPTGDADALPEDVSGEILTIDQLRDASCDNAAGTTYTAVFAEGGAQAPEPSPDPQPAPDPEPKPADGWHQGSDGRWTLVEGGEAVRGRWALVGGAWYHFGADGTMQTGWLSDGGSWYYLRPSGAMATGWLADGGHWYYLGSSGAMATGWVLDGGLWYYMRPGGDGPAGSMATGWRLVDGSWYYLYPQGHCATSTVIDGWRVDASGRWVG